MRVFIAGATGVLGRRMVRQFTEKGHSVVGLARDEKGKQTIQKLGGESVVADIFDADSTAAAVGQADVVIHAATSIPAKVSSGPADWELNDRLRREGTQALTEAAAKLGAKTYIQQSVVWVARPADDSFFDEKTAVEQPDELYRSAFDGEQIARAAGEKYGFEVAGAAVSTRRTRTTLESSPRAYSNAGCRSSALAKQSRQTSTPTTPRVLSSPRRRRGGAGCGTSRTTSRRRSGRCCMSSPGSSARPRPDGFRCGSPGCSSGRA